MFDWSLFGVHHAYTHPRVQVNFKAAGYYVRFTLQRAVSRPRKKLERHPRENDTCESLFTPPADVFVYNLQNYCHPGFERIFVMTHYPGVQWRVTYCMSENPLFRIYNRCELNVLLNRILGNIENPLDSQEFCSHNLGYSGQCTNLLKETENSCFISLMCL